MKKFYVSICALALMGLTANAQSGSLYSTDFATDDDFAAWTVVDANNDDRTWTFDGTNQDFKVFYNYHGTNKADDWFYSPVITPETSGQHLISFQVKGSSYGEDLEIWTGKKTDQGYAMENKVATYNSIGADALLKNILVELEAGKPVVVAFHAISEPDKYRLYLNNFSLSYIEHPADIAVKNISAPFSGENLGLETVKALVANEGPETITSWQMSYTVSLAGQEAETITETVNTSLEPGATMEYSFSQKADFSTPRGIYSLSVSANVDGDINASNNSVQSEIRHLAPAELPYFMGFEADEDTGNISTINCNNDGGDWNINVDSWFTHFAHTGSACMAYNYDSNNAADDWFFLDPFALKKGYYALKFWYSALENHPEKLRVCYGTAPTPDAMTNVLVEYNPINNSNYEESINIFQIPSDGKYYIGFYAFSDANENWLLIDDISLEQIDPNAADLEILSFTQPFDYWREPNSTNVVFTARNIGIVDVDAKVRFYINDQFIEKTETIRAQEIKEISLESSIASLEPGTYNISVELVYDNDSKPENNRMEKSLVVLPKSVALWDFENTQNIGTPSTPHYELPKDLTFRAEDSHTIHPDAGAEFEEHGWGIFMLQHYMLGTRALAGCSWFQSSGMADRWVVLPQVKVTGENAYFAWDATSYNPKYLEDYRVKVSKGSDHWSDYNTEFSIDGETSAVKTRGISLANYVGETVYVAINLVTSGGDAIVLDNLGFYGDIEYNSGITEVATDGNAYLVTDGSILTIKAAGEIKNIELFNLQGIKVAQSSTDNIEIETLPAGLYIVKAETTQGSQTFKFNR